MSDALIEFHKLSKSYLEAERRLVVFDAINGSINSGEFVVLVGKSGCGKSTLLNLLSGIDAADSGDIIIKGRSLVHMDERARTLFRRTHIGFVFQAYNLVPTLTVMDNLLLPLELAAQLTDEGRDRARGLLDRLGVLDKASNFPDQLSGGEQQRIAIARALVHQPAIILADEPTGNLDQETSQEVLGLLDELVREAGMTLVMVTHSHEVIGLADRLLSIHDHKLVELDRAQ